MSFEQKHPIIVPQCTFTTTIIRELHHQHLHPGPTMLLSIIRQHFWPLKAKSTSLTHNCHTCFKVKPRTSHQMTSDLPEARVKLTRPFVNTAVEYAGFYTIRSRTTRNAPHTKCYIPLFKCMCTGAIHLELVSDLTAKLWIDLHHKEENLQQYSVTTELASMEPTWNLIRYFLHSTKLCNNIASNKQSNGNTQIYHRMQAGGIYESGIINMKHHLERVMTTVYTFEQFVIILCKVEAVLNSRPLTPLSDDPTDIRVLTFQPHNAMCEKLHQTV